VVRSKKMFRGKKQTNMVQYKVLEGEWNFQKDFQIFS